MHTMNIIQRIIHPQRQISPVHTEPVDPVVQRIAKHHEESTIDSIWLGVASISHRLDHEIAHISKRIGMKLAALEQGMAELAAMQPKHTKLVTKPSWARHIPDISVSDRERFRKAGVHQFWWRNAARNYARSISVGWRNGKHGPRKVSAQHIVLAQHPERGDWWAYVGQFPRAEQQTYNGELWQWGRVTKAWSASKECALSRPGLDEEHVDIKTEWTVLLADPAMKQEQVLLAEHASDLAKLGEVEIHYIKAPSTSQAAVKALDLSKITHPQVIEMLPWEGKDNQLMEESYQLNEDII